MKDCVSNCSLVMQSLYLVFACLRTSCRSWRLTIFWVRYDSNHIQLHQHWGLFINKPIQNSDRYFNCGVEVHAWTLLHVRFNWLICVMLRCPVEQKEHNDHLVARSSVRYFPSAVMVPVARYLSHSPKQECNLIAYPMTLLKHMNKDRSNNFRAVEVCPDIYMRLDHCMAF